MQKSLIVSERVHNELVKLKMLERARNIDEVINSLIIEYRKQKLHEFSKKFRKALKEKGMTFEDFLKEARKVREEIADEEFPD